MADNGYSADDAPDHSLALIWALPDPHLGLEPVVGNGYFAGDEPDRSLALTDPQLDFHFQPVVDNGYFAGDAPDRSLALSDPNPNPLVGDNEHYYAGALTLILIEQMEVQADEQVEAENIVVGVEIVMGVGDMHC